MCMQAQQEARHVFNDVLDRAAESERIKGSLAMLRQYGSLFRLPARIRSATAHSEYQQVLGLACPASTPCASALCPDLLELCLHVAASDLGGHTRALRPQASAREDDQTMIKRLHLTATVGRWSQSTRRHAR